MSITLSFVNDRFGGARRRTAPLVALSARRGLIPLVAVLCGVHWGAAASAGPGFEDHAFASVFAGSVNPYVGNKDASGITVATTEVSGGSGFAGDSYEAKAAAGI